MAKAGQPELPLTELGDDALERPRMLKVASPYRAVPVPPEWSVCFLVGSAVKKTHET